MMDVIDMMHIMANMDIMNAISIMPIMDIILIIIYDTSNILPHLAVRRPCLLPIFALVGTAEPPLAAGGCAGESVLRTGGTPQRASGTPLRFEISRFAISPWTLRQTTGLSPFAKPPPHGGFPGEQI